MQVERDARLDEHRLDQRPIRLAMPIRDRHLPELDPLRSPLEAGARSRPHLPRRVGCGHEPHRPVRLDAGSRRRREQCHVEPVERRLWLRRAARGEHDGTLLHQAQTEGGDGRLLGGGRIGQVDGDRHPLGDADDQPLERRRHIEQSPHEQAESIEPARIGGDQRVVGAVEAGAPLLERGQDLGQRASLFRRVGRAFQQRSEVGEVVARPAQLPHQAEQRLAKPWGLRHRREVPRVRARDVGEQDPVSERRQRPAPVGDERRCA